MIYGYLWDEKREHWLVDEEAAEVVRRIFSLTLEGYGPYQIACKLSADRIEIPVVHLASDLIRPISLQREGKDTAYHFGGFLIYQPMFPLFIPQVAVNHSTGQVLATHAF